MAIVGQYDLWVRRGAVNIMGATLHASPKLHRVYAPSTHSLPVIRYARNPYGPANQPVEITILSCRSQLRLLRRLSWRFAKIWNRKPSKTGASVPCPNLLRSFGYVHYSRWCCDVQKLIRFFSWLRRRMTPSSGRYIVLTSALTGSL